MICKTKLASLVASLFIVIGTTLTHISQVFAAENPYLEPSPPPIPYPTINYGTANAQLRALIDRGQYLARAGDCIACHTDTLHNGSVLSGGLGISTPFGTFYTPNITPDKSTGIGSWSNQDFIHAMQEGIDPHGSYYFPVFPYTNFTRVNKDDLMAIKAYLFSLKPIHQAPTPNQVPWPLSWRFLQLGWRILFFHPGEYQYDPNHTAQWNRGAYLVDGLAHCGMCHTPINFLGAPKNKYYLTGGFVNGYYAPDITSVGLKGATTEEIVEVFTKNKMLRGAGDVQGPMAEANRNSFRYLTHEDLTAIAVYLQTVKSEEPPKSSGGQITAGTGKKIYDAHCAVCHATGAAGAPKLGDASDWSNRLKQQGLDILIQRAINGFNSMPPKGTCMSCSDDEIKAAVNYLIDQSKPGAAAVSSSPATNYAPPPRLTLADGKRIYDAHCSACHAKGVLGAPKLGDKDAWSPLLAKNMDVLFSHAVNVYNRKPLKPYVCPKCSDADVIAAVIYMAQQGKSTGDYSLW